MNTQLQKLTVQDSKLKLKFSVIGFGNARYNSAVPYQNNLLISCTAFIKLINIPKSQILFTKQIGNSQITQIQKSQKYIMIVNFQGLITLLDINNLQILHQFKTNGKQVRHACITKKFISTSSELINNSDASILEVFSLEKIQNKNYNPIFSKQGYFYYPQISKDQLIVLEYHDPNPKNKKRTDTVLQKKLPIVNTLNHFFSFKQVVYKQIKHSSQIICTTFNGKFLYYLHNDKHLTIYNIQSKQFLEYSCKHIKTVLMSIQNFYNGIIFSSANNQFTQLFIGQNNQIITKKLQIKSPATTAGFCYKFQQAGFFSFNQNGLHYYNYDTKKTHTLNLFTITNCGLAISPSNQLFAIGDFGGCIYVYPTQYLTANYESLYTTFIGTPIRALTWGVKENEIIIGTLGGQILIWNYLTGEQPELIYHLQSTNINILRTTREYYIAGTSSGDIIFISSNTHKKIFQHKGHSPIHYEDPKDRQLFGSLKHYAQIWSLAVSPKQQFLISSTSEDQTKKVFKVELENKLLQQKHHLKGHELAVTSVDWQIMNQKIGQIYVSCSDDKKVIFRDPNKNFEVLFQIQTSTIKQWHTLTYLALEAGGNKVAIGSQNGYLFIYNIQKRQFEYAEKVNLGGIQGLVWGKNILITISSDLCINIIQIQNN